MATESTEDTEKQSITADFADYAGEKKNRKPVPSTSFRAGSEQSRMDRKS
jgi:hypothetical protein